MYSTIPSFYGKRKSNPNKNVQTNSITISYKKQLNPVIWDTWNNGMFYEE